MCREIAVARKSYPASNFAPSHNWNILPSRKIRLFLLKKSFSYVSYQKASFFYPNSFFYRHGHLQQLWRGATILFFPFRSSEIFCRVFEALRLAHAQLVRFTPYAILGMAEMTTMSERGLVKLAPRPLSEHQNLEFGPLECNFQTARSRTLDISFPPTLFTSFSITCQ